MVLRMGPRTLHKKKRFKTETSPSSKGNQITQDIVNMCSDSAVWVGPRVLISTGSLEAYAARSGPVMSRR